MIFEEGWKSEKGIMVLKLKYGMKVPHVLDVRIKRT
jgi:hypothetical protein